MKRTSLILYILAILFVFNSCKKDEETSAATTGQITLDFDPRFGENPFDFDVNYVLDNGEVVKFSEFKYFISNIEFVKDEKVVYKVPQNETYFFINNKKIDSRKLLISNVPVDEYTEIRFVVGVDSLMNTKDIEDRPSSLDVGGEAEGMYWSWNNGYIFLKVEGTHTPREGDPVALKYHIGGFGGYNTPTINNIKNVSISRANDAPIPVRSDKVSDVHILVDLKNMFEQPTSFSVKENHTVMLTEFSKTVAINYATMFRLDHVH